MKYDYTGLTQDLNDFDMPKNICNTIIYIQVCTLKASMTTVKMICPDLRKFLTIKRRFLVNFETIQNSMLFFNLMFYRPTNSHFVYYCICEIRA